MDSVRSKEAAFIYLLPFFHLWYRMTDFSDVVAHFDSDSDGEKAEKTYRGRDGATWKHIFYPDFRESMSAKAWRYASDQGQLLSRDLRILSSKPGKGYVTTTLPIHIEGTYGATTHTTLHRIIAFTFLGPPPDKLSVYTVDHINRNKEDNRATNLQWATPQEQLANREMSWYQLQTTDGRTFSSVAQLAKDTNIQGKALRTQLRQTVKGNVVIVNDVKIHVEGVWGPKSDDRQTPKAATNRQTLNAATNMLPMG
jgi:lambda repressor-like predicted transcriptional regulator